MHNLTSLFKELEKERHIKPQINRWEEIIKKAADINQNGKNRKSVELSWFF